MPLLIFILLPIIELTIFIKVGEVTGALFVISAIFISAMLGVSIVRHQGFSTLRRVNEKLQKGESSAEDVISGFLLALAGLLLVLPGFLTDSFGVLLLIPPVRLFLAKYLVKKGGGQHFQFYGFNQKSHTNHGDVFEGEYTQEQDDPERLNYSQESRSQSKEPKK
ncbi:MAG: FxsA family protein [Cellvibrionales bacterium]|nr:FxsA family protein [Cellvibrionales bacterium]